MKKRIPTMIVALVLVCFLLELAPTVLRSTGLAEVKWDSLVGRHGFYFQKRQWLADLRTIMAAFHYLCTSHPAAPLSFVDVPPASPLQTETSTNLLGTNGTASSMPTAAKTLSRADRIMARYRRLYSDRQPPMITFAGGARPAFLGSNAPVWL